MNVNARLESCSTQKLPCLVERSFPSDSICSVYVNHIEEDGSLWVMLQSDVQIMEVLSDALNEPNSKRELNPVLNHAYSVLNTDDTWYRAVVESIHPEILVRFIDFGDTATVPLQNIAPLPTTLSIVPQLAMKVKLLDDKVIPTVGENLLLKHCFSIKGSVVVDVVLSEKEPSPDSTECPVVNSSSEAGNDNDNSLSCTVDFNSSPHEELETAIKSSASNEAPIHEVTASRDVNHPPEVFHNPECDSHFEVSSCQEADLHHTVSSDSGVLKPEKVPSSSFTSFDSINQSHCETVDADGTLMSAPSSLHSLSISNDAVASLERGLAESRLVCTKEITISEKYSGESMANGASSSVEDTSQDLTNKYEGSLSPQAPISSNASRSSEKKDDSSTLGSCEGEGQMISSSDLVKVPSKSPQQWFTAGGKRYVQEVLKSTGLAQRPQSDVTEVANDHGSTKRIITKGRVASNYSQNLKSAPQKASLSRFPDLQGVLESELSIIREENRIQILQLQNKIDESLANHKKIIREEVDRRLAEFHREVGGQLHMMSDSVVVKVAQVFSNIALSKNDNQSHKNPSPGNPVSFCTDTSSMPPNLNSQFSSSVQHHPDHCATEDFKIDSFSGSYFNKENLSKSPSTSDTCHYNSQNQHSAYFSNNLQEGETYDMKSSANNLMAQRKAKIFGSDRSNGEQSIHNSNSVDGAQQRSTTPSFDSSTYPKMDYFDPSKTGLENNGETSSSKTASGCIVCINNLNPEKMTPDLIFNLIGVYGNVQRVKISNQDKGRAYVEMADPAQAEEVVKHLNKVPLMGQRLHINRCNFTKLNLSRQEFTSNTCKDYTKPQLHKLNRFSMAEWDPNKLAAPSYKLAITNVLNEVTDEKVKEEFLKRGFHIQDIYTIPTYVNKEKKKLILTMSSVEEAVNALTMMHLQELSDWVRMYISFGKPDKFSPN